MDLDTAKQEKRIRIGTTKVRTGCVTCKIRRVKCGEEKPACRRCTSTGRKCDGYQALFHVTSRKGPPKCTVLMNGGQQVDHAAMNAVTTVSRARPANVMPKDVWFSPPPTCNALKLARNEKESRSIDFFIARTGPQLAGLFDSKFWCDMVLRISQYNPAVRLCAVAVSSMHECFEKKIIGSALQNSKESSYAMQQYNKAVGSLSKQLSRGEASLEVILTCCILFVCLEFLQGETRPAFSHIESGHKILADWKRQQNSNCSKSALIRKGNAGGTGMEEILIPILSHLDILGVLFGQKPSGIDWIGAGCLQPETIESLDHARLSILSVLNSSLSLETSIITAGGFVEFPNIGDHFLLETRLEEWQQAFIQFQKRSPFLSTRDERASLLIRIHYHITRVLVKTNLASDEMIYDSCIVDFEAIVSLSEMKLDMGPDESLQSERQQQPCFTFDMGTISPLYYTALKCRRSSVRRKAVALLSKGPRRESIWDAHVCAQVCERVIALEEEGWTPSDETDGTLDADRRIDRVIIMAAPNFNNGSHIVCHFSKLDRQANAWTSWDETFPDVLNMPTEPTRKYFDFTADQSELFDKSRAANFADPLDVERYIPLTVRERRISGLE